MSFFGKKFKKVNAENVEELMTALKIGEKIRSLITRPDTETSFSKNEDGSIQYVIEAHGVKGLDERIVLDDEAEYTSPDGRKSKNIFHLDGNVLTATMTNEEGVKIYYVRTFGENTLKLEITADGISTKGVVYYEAI